MNREINAQAYVFHRKGNFYTLRLNNDQDAIENALCNEGTTKVTNIKGRTVWKLTSNKDSK